jgi:phage/plasmid-like protein (TIGR03299 family)
MSHGILNSKHFAYVNEPAWHGLGNTPANGKPITRQWLETETEFCHTVFKKPYLFPNGIEASKAFYLETSDGHIINDLVGDRYTPLQCSDILDIAEPLMSSYYVETAGRLFNGGKVFVVFKLKDKIVVGNNDVVDNYVVLMDSRDGRAPKLYLTPVRVVCNNTLNLSLGQVKATSNGLRHTANVMGRINDAVVEMGLLEKESEKIETVFSQMLGMEINMMQLLADTMLSEKQLAALKSGEAVATRTLNDMRTILDGYNSAPGQAIAPANSAWKAYNAVTYYFSHGKNRKGAAERMDNLLFGTDANTVGGIMDYCLVPQRTNRDLVSRLESQLF